MNVNSAKVHREEAESCRTESNHLDAGDHFTAEAHLEFGDSRRVGKETTHSDVADINTSTIGLGFKALLRATLSYRLADLPARARNRSRQGILLAEDLREHEPLFDDPARRGLCYELVGDFRLFGDLDGHRSAYEEARERYETYADESFRQVQWQSEPEFEFPLGVLLELISATDWTIDEETRSGIAYRSLLDRIDYKREHYSTILRRALDDSDWSTKTVR